MIHTSKPQVIAVLFYNLISQYRQQWGAYPQVEFVGKTTRLLSVDVENGKLVFIFEGGQKSQMIVENAKGTIGGLLLDVLTASGEAQIEEK